MSIFPEVNTDTTSNPRCRSGAALPVLVDSDAPWCSPCKRLEPILEQLSSEWAGKATLVKVNVDESPELAMKYQVMSVPTVIMFRDGRGSHD